MPALSPDVATRPRMVAAVRAVEHAVERMCALLAAALLAAEIVVLLAGVVSRYVFGSPLIWTEELASTLFLWLVMLGAVVALGRGEAVAHAADAVGRAARVRHQLPGRRRMSGWPTCARSRSTRCSGAQSATTG